MAVVFGRAGGAGTATPTIPPLVGARRARRRFGDRGFREITRAAGLSLVVMVAGMAAVMVHAAWPSLRRFGWAFIMTSNWDPVAEQFGALPFIFGTLVSSLLAMLLAVPLGLGAAIYLSELAPRAVRPPVTFLIELLAAIPSVVYGLWGIFVLAPWLRTWVQPALGHTLGFLPLFQGPPYGVGMLAAGLILAVMIVPFITAVSREVVLAVARMQREAALGPGATGREATPVARPRYGPPGLIRATLLGVGRAL